MSLRSWWRRIRSDGAICAASYPDGRCEDHARLYGPCRCLEPVGHRGGHECGQGARWLAQVKV